MSTLFLRRLGFDDKRRDISSGSSRIMIMTPPSVSFSALSHPTRISYIISSRIVFLLPAYHVPHSCMMDNLLSLHRALLMPPAL